MKQADEDLIRESRWALGWLVGLIEDGRVNDLAEDDEYSERAVNLLAALNARRRKEARP